MAIYLCRWPNGDFSIMNATTKNEAIELLDEWGNAERAIVSRMTHCMFDFRLGEEAELKPSSNASGRCGRQMDFTDNPVYQPQSHLVS
jgi:hypothetical protein